MLLRRNDEDSTKDTLYYIFIYIVNNIISIKLYPKKLFGHAFLMYIQCETITVIYLVFLYISVLININNREDQV